MGCDVKVGNNVPLSAQVECPEGTAVFIKAFIFNSSNIQLDTRDMIDRGDGSFENFTYVMPNIDIIKIKYLAFEDATYTTQIEEPCPGSETFTKLEESGAGSDITNVEVVGKIISGVIIGKVFGQKTLKGQINLATLKGRVQGASLLKGKILNSTIQGRIICKK